MAHVFAVREPSGERRLVGLPELTLRGLGERDARALLETVIPGRIDERVRDRSSRRPRGNPLPLLELPRGSIEDGFLRQLDALPADSRRLLQLAAADPVDEPLLLWRAAEVLDVHPEAVTPAVDAGLVEIRAQVRFRHPLVRSAAYRSVSPTERNALHGPLPPAQPGDSSRWTRSRRG